MKIMKKMLILMFSALMIFSLAACSAQVNETPKSAPDNVQNNTQTEKTATSEMNSNENKENNAAGKQIKVTAQNGEVIVFALNDSQAAQDLYNQLSITVEVENFSSNEKIFYPPDKLNTENTPNPSSVRVGTLAYYRPWGNVVMFYDSLNPNSDLYELGYAVSGQERIENLSGTITVEKSE